MPASCAARTAAYVASCADVGSTMYVRPTLEQYCVYRAPTDMCTTAGGEA